MTTQSFTLTIEFNEALQLTVVPDGDVPILAESNITLTNATSSDITIENNDGKGRVVITDIELDLSKPQATITISGDSYSDTLGNTGENDYTLTIDTGTLVSGLLAAAECQKFSFDGGTGSSGNPYQISNICQLQNIDADNITAGGVAYTNLLDKDYILIADIDASYTRNWDSKQGFNPIGDTSNRYTGKTFDGNGYAIHNLYINRPNTDDIGLFSINDENSEIKYLAVVHSYIVGGSDTGGILGSIYGNLISSVASGSISGTQLSGGLFGNLNGTVNANSINMREKNISSVSIKTSKNIAGIVGGNIANVPMSFLKNNIGVGSVLGNNVVGIIGLQGVDSIVDNNLGLASINGNIDVGGLIGHTKPRSCHYE